MGLLEGQLSADDDALLGQDLGLSSRNGDLEGLGGCGAGKLALHAARMAREDSLRRGNGTHNRR